MDDWDEFIEGVRAEVRARLAAYEYPLIFAYGNDDVIEVEIPDLDPEDEARACEIVLAGQGLNVPGVILLCRHEAGGFMLAIATPEEWEFRHLDPVAGTEDQMARPDFWGLGISDGTNRGMAS